METLTGPHLGAFVVVAMLLCITPGPDIAIMTQNALLRGRGAAFASALGIELGLTIWATAAVVGLAAVLQSSAELFGLVKLAGAAYLIWLGVRSLLELRSNRGTHAPARAAVGTPFRQGLMSNLLNPKIAVFFTSVIPQFVDPGPHAAMQTATLGYLFVLIGLCWAVSFAFVAGSVAPVLARPALRRGIGAISGTVLIGLGARLAVDRS